jgi:hypothetical protein
MRGLLSLLLLVCGCHPSQDTLPDASAHKLGQSEGTAPQLFMLSGDSSDAASTTTIGPSVADLEHYDFLVIDAKVVGATGGTTDVYLQKLVATSPDVWIDWLHLPQVAAGATKVFNVASDYLADPYPALVGTGTDDAATPTLEAGVLAHGHPGCCLRLVTVTGSGVTASAVMSVWINGHSRN